MLEGPVSDFDVEACRLRVRRDPSGRRLCNLCDGTHRSRGMCDRHYRNWSRTGDPHRTSLACTVARCSCAGKVHGAAVAVEAAATPRRPASPKPKPTGLPAWLDLTRLARTRPLPGWERYAACAGRGFADFFPDDGTSAKPAKETCEGCPVRYACLAHQIATSSTFDDHGVRGGTSVRERRRIRTALYRLRAAA